MYLFNIGNRVIMLVSQNELRCYLFSCVFWKGLCRIVTFFFFFFTYFTCLAKLCRYGVFLMRRFLTTHLNTLIDIELFRVFFFLILSWVDFARLCYLLAKSCLIFSYFLFNITSIGLEMISYNFCYL